MKLVVLFGLVFLIGVLTGYFLFRLRLLRTASGTLRVDRSDPDGPYLFLELHSSPVSLITKKYVSLLVDAKDHTQD